MDDSIIILDSDDEDYAGKEAKQKMSSETAVANGKRHNPANSETESPPAKHRRIQPQKIGEVTKNETSSNNSSQESISTDTRLKDSSCTVETTSCNEAQSSQDASTSNDAKKEKRKNEITKELEGFINACRKAENNSDMKKIIKTKLIKYYDMVHPEYAVSKHLCKMLENTALAILRDPKSVYSKLQDVINELKSRKNCGSIAMPPPPTESASQSEDVSSQNSEEIQSTGDEKKDKQLKKLNKALTKLKKAIEDLEEAEVNLDEDEDSAYIKKVKYEKRAVEIYNKICDITGESTHAHRIGKQPIKFKNTKYDQFNRKLSKKVNKDNGFPSYYDVYRLLDFCNKEYKYGLLREEIQNIAQSAFVEVGKLLKERRCNDLYESAEHYAGKNKDPAKEDPELKAKLEKNKEYYSKKTDEIMQLFVLKQKKIETEDTSDGGEASTSNMLDLENGTVKLEPDVKDDNLVDLQSLPTKKLMIDIKAECDIKKDETQDTSSGIDLAILL